MTTLSKLLRQDVVAICHDDGRKVGTPGHDDAREYLRQRISEIGCVPYIGKSFELPYKVAHQGFCNLVGRIPGRDSKLPPLLVGAHYDSVISFPCADDNAAAVAIALHAGRIIGESGGLERDVVVAIFDAEEPPYFQGHAMGSNRFYEDHVLGKREIHAALVMDLVGHDVSLPDAMSEGLPVIDPLTGSIYDSARRDTSNPALRSLLFVTGSESHQELTGVLGAIGQPKGLRVMPTLNSYVGDMSDHGVFRRNGVPYFFLSCGMWEHYHMPTDTPDRLNYDKMSAITHYVIQMITLMGERELAGRTGKEQIHDTLDLESSFMREAFGDLQQLVMRWAGISDVDTRATMSQLVERLLLMGLR